MSKLELYFTLNGERLPTKGTENLTMLQVSHMLAHISELKLCIAENKKERIKTNN